MDPNSFNSKFVYSQPFSNHSNKSSQNTSRNNFISLPVTTKNHFTNFPVNKVMVLPSSSVPKIIPILTSPDNQPVPNKFKYKEREYNDIKTYNQPVFNKAEGRERDFRTDNRIVSSKGKEREHTFIRTDYRLASSKGKEREYNDIDIVNQPVYNEAKIKEREHIDIISSIAEQDDEEIDMEIDDDIPQPAIYFSNQLTEIGHASNQASSNKLTKTDHVLNQALSNKLTETKHVSNQVLSNKLTKSEYASNRVPSNKLTETGHVLNQVPVEQKLNSSISFVGKVIRFLNSYNYEFDIFNLMIDFSNKYQEIFQSDSVYLKPYHNNSYILLHQLSIILVNKINSGNLSEFLRFYLLKTKNLTLVFISKCLWNGFF